jgi:hypothetical protein
MAGLLSAYAPWPWPILWGLWLVVLIAGFVLPARFPSAASVKLAGSEKAIQKSTSLMLAACAGARARWYRDAELGVHGNGEVNGRVRTAQVRLLARKRGGVLLVGSARIEVQDRKTRAWSVVADAAAGHTPSAGARYRAAGTFFMVDPG